MRCGGRTPTTPIRSPDSLTIRRARPKTVRGSMPPSGFSFTDPSSQMSETTKPISSMWAAIITRGVRPPRRAGPVGLRVQMSFGN